ncbi:hypothetical protein L602_000700000610 [Cupriavidus gilardii J11]|uniref:Uncharacterized protein n=1 Tax=Cupriavidus gilardii J11 TaxID=936133 RepID=A0A562B241_9BURK|nr:hypothetical protein [Cupriavidus gilardii]TWG79245.1 hypothetical protein L602_000700000610 [Cupriavidus gilardii J11]
MQGDDWRVEVYRGVDVHVRVAERGDGTGRWGYEIRISQEGLDAADASEVEIISSGDQVFATRHAAEVAAFSVGYANVDKVLGPQP